MLVSVMGLFYEGGCRLTYCIVGIFRSSLIFCSFRSHSLWNEHLPNKKCISSMPHVQNCKNKRNKNV